jgi:hypothetical protein
VTRESAAVLAMRQLVAEAALFRRGTSRSSRSAERLAALEERRATLRAEDREKTER